MPWLYFEDWAEWVDSVKTGNLPIGNTLVKVYAAPDNPQHIFSEPSLFTLEMDGSPFALDTVYSFEGRARYGGAQLEGYIREIADKERTRQYMRALFRFAHMHGFLASAMAYKVSEQYAIEHPMEVVHGQVWANRMPLMLHLDVFLRSSLEVLKTVVDYDNPSLLVKPRWGLNWRKTQKY
jgi:hypothetical protein